MATLIIPIVLTLVGALVSFVGMILAKEQKISEFRQAWIDALRSDLALLEAHILSIHASHTAYSFSLNKTGTNLVEAGKDPDFVKDTKADYLEINQASMRIRLRLNPSEKSHSRLLALMGESETAFKIADPGETPFEAIDKLTTEITNASQMLLKEVWEEVKSGEPNFKRTKKVAMVTAIVTLILLSVALAFQAYRTMHPPRANSPHHYRIMPLETE